MEGRQPLKTVLALWKEAADAYAAGDFEGSIEKFLQIEELSARMLYNMACAYIRLNKMTLALQCLSVAVKKDQHLAIAFFQKGVLNLRQMSLKSAIEDLNQAKTLMRGNDFIDYKLLGMYTKLGKFEISYNLALAYLHDKHTREAEALFTEALHDADIRQRKLLISALEHIQDKRPSLITPIEIAVTNIFTPPKSVVENLEKKNVIGSAKVVSATDKHDTDPSFNGKKRVEELKRSPPISPKSIRSPLLRVKRFLLRQPRVKSGAEANVLSLGGMRAAHSTGDIRSLPNTNDSDQLSQSLATGGLRIVHSRSCGDTFSMFSLGDSPPSSVEDFHVESPRKFSNFRIVHSGSLEETGKTTTEKPRQTSIDEACSASASCIARALSSNCDVTIVVTPPVSESNETNGFLNENGQTTDQTVCQVDKSETNGNKVTGDFLADDAEINNNIYANDLRNVSVNSTSKNAGFKPRPPPPSYPPPPLPSKVLFSL